MEEAQNTSDHTNPPPSSDFSKTLLHKTKQNLIFRSKWAELNGAMGDLGTYIPIILALTLSKNLNLGTTLIFTGVYNIITGALYGVPMPVQPMKSIAAAAISSPDFGVPEIMAAGICTGAILLVLGVTGLMKFVYKLIPLPIVRGIQLAQGLNFAMIAVKYVRNDQNFATSKSIGVRAWLGLDGLVLAVVCACFIVLVNGAGEEINNGVVNDQIDAGAARQSTRIRVRRVLTSLPSAFMIFVLGVILAFVRDPRVVDHIKFGPSKFSVVHISKEAWKNGFIKGTIPQLPLSILNSVVAVCKLSYDLFPEKDFTPTSVTITVGLMNLVGTWFGAMPSCHGAGGLAGQYKFGGRSGACVAILGAAKLVLGLVLGSSLVKILTQFPVGVLGVLLLFAGIELAMAARDMNTKEDAFVVLICTSVSLVGSSAALGFGCAIVAHVLIKLRCLSEDDASCASIWRLPA
ncbi:unnamed protein product [Rhodiola kirilowii]